MLEEEKNKQIQNNVQHCNNEIYTDYNKIIG